MRVSLWVLEGSSIAPGLFALPTRMAQPFPGLAENIGPLASDLVKTPALAAPASPKLATYCPHRSGQGKLPCYGGARNLVSVAAAMAGRPACGAARTGLLARRQSPGDVPRRLDSAGAVLAIMARTRSIVALPSSEPVGPCASASGVWHSRASRLCSKP